VVENRPGAGSNLATADVAHAPPDGYMLMLLTTANVINATLVHESQLRSACVTLRRLEVSTMNRLFSK
jgi:tripartite-type tricarboxylate transporter receptor subunit TctC